MLEAMKSTDGDRSGRRSGYRRFLGGLLCLLAVLPAVQARELYSYAIVEDDASLLIQNTRVHLYGIHIPDTGRSCETRIRPVKCASRAALALEFKIQGFVRCEILESYRDGSAGGQCFYDGEDLAAYLIGKGWALALPDAPFGYHAQERIARHRDMGVWGFTTGRH